MTLRAVVQDYLLPTIAYYGGAAVAYFAQTAEVYRVLERPATPILPRSSLTMIERHTGRVLKIRLNAQDFSKDSNRLSSALSKNISAPTRRSCSRSRAERQS